MKNKFNFIIIFALLVVVISLFSSARMYSILDKYLLYIFLIFDFVMLLVNSNGKFKKNIKLFLISIAALIMILSLVLSFGGIGSFLCIVNFIILIYLSKDKLINNKNYKDIFFLIIIFYILNVYTSFSVWEKYLIHGNVINPNTVAIILIYMTIILSFLISKSKLKNNKVLIVILCCFTLFCILNCHCRNALTALLLFLIIILIPKMEKYVSKHIGFILFLIVFIGLIIPFIYSQGSLNEINILSNLTEKSIYSGREIIWKNMILALSQNRIGYLIGLGSHHVTSLGIIVNYHTWYLGIIYMYGVPIFLVYFYYLIRRIKSLKHDILKIGCVAIFFTGIFETSAIWIYIQFLLFLLLFMDFYDNKKEES